jgi:hypothetical protein
MQSVADIASRSSAGARSTLLSYEQALESLSVGIIPDRKITTIPVEGTLHRRNFGRRSQFCVLYFAEDSVVQIVFVGRAEQVHEGLRLEEPE